MRYKGGEPFSWQKACEGTLPRKMKKGLKVGIHDEVIGSSIPESS